jgi:hypothetical protein
MHVVPADAPIHLEMKRLKLDVEAYAVLQAFAAGKSSSLYWGMPLRGLTQVHWSRWTDGPMGR